MREDAKASGVVQTKGRLCSQLHGQGYEPPEQANEGMYLNWTPPFWFAFGEGQSKHEKLARFLLHVGVSCPYALSTSS